jgi:tRNA-specific 2-thiouridylase
VSGFVSFESGSLKDAFGGVGSDSSALKGKKIVVGMSGGVDSSVAALLLKQAGAEVIGLFMNNWKEEDGGVCTSAADWEDVIGVCGKLDIPYYSVDFSEEYMKNVFETFLREYEIGRTPNPDVLCNREIKFKPFKHYAEMLGADYIATGHYCGIRQNNTTELLTAADESKDQTYFLNQVETQSLNNVLFPLASMRKKDVRALAEKHSLVTAEKKDSTGVCFIGERNFKKFLSGYLPACSGEIRDLSGKVVGRHDGLMYYTLGQRRGLGIGGIKGERENRWYVVEKNLKDNILVVSCGEGEELMSQSLRSGKFNVIGERNFGHTFECGVKVRYRQPCQRASVEIKKDGTLKIKFFDRQRAVTAGQYAVLYKDGRCLGGATIEEVFR